MRCKYESFGCYYKSIHSSHSSGSSSIKGLRKMNCKNVDLHSLCSWSVFWPTPTTNGSLPQPCPLCLLFFLKHPVPLFVLPSPHLVFSLSLKLFSTCRTELCPAPCGSHGICSEGQCQCEDGWIGATCDQRACHPRCEEHGQCQDGTCICQPGWEGEHCNIGKLCVCMCVHMWETLIIPSDVLIMTEGEAWHRWINLL